MSRRSDPPSAQRLQLVWALHARRPGDNAQIDALAHACGLPFETKRLSFRKGLEALPNLRPDGSLFSLTAEAQDAISHGPWPDIVIAAGKRSAPAALWLKRCSGARLLHLGRTWAPGHWFDAIVTTPQYAQPPGPNVVTNRFPLTSPARLHPRLAPDLAALPRPRILVAAGGDAAGMRFDADAAAGLAARALALQAERGGSLMVATSPRTSAKAAAALRALLPEDASRIFSLFGRGPNRYRDFLAAADAALVTGDSVSMVADAAATGAPVEIFELPPAADRSAALRHALRRVGLADRAAAAGLVDSGRSIARALATLQAEGWLAGGRAPGLMAQELAAAAERVRSLAGVAPLQARDRSADRGRAAG